MSAEQEPAAAPVEAAQVKPRRGPVRRTLNIPDLARRGRTTLRHLICLLLGGYIAWVRTRRSRGARGPLYGLQKVVALLFALFVDRRIAAMPFPAQLRHRLETLGPTYVKLCQILSLRLDILPEVVTRELRSLLSNLPEVDFEAIAEIIAADLGRPLDELFSFVDPQPLGSASIAQIHRATTVDGKDVIVKVVKPGIRDLLYRDADLLRLSGRILQLIIPRYQPRKLADEFCDYTLEEVDMTREAEHAETFARNFKDLPEVVFPEVYREYSGASVLCMQFLDGKRPDADLAGHLTLDERQQLIDVGAAAIIRMLYEDGFFHADLHPGNLLVLPDNRIGFIDLGMVGRLDPDLRHHLLNLFYSLVLEDYEGGARHLSMVAQSEPRSDVVGFRRAVRETCRKWRRAATFEDFSLAQLILESVRLGARYQLYFPVEMVLMVKALVTYEGVGYLLDPSFNVAEVSKRHVQRIFRTQFSPVRLLREGVRGAPELIDAAMKLPVLINESLRLIEYQTRKKPESPMSGLRATVTGGFCLLSGAILLSFGGPWVVAMILLALGLILPMRR